MFVKKLTWKQEWQIKKGYCCRAPSTVPQSQGWSKIFKCIALMLQRVNKEIKSESSHSLKIIILIYDVVTIQRYDNPKKVCGKAEDRVHLQCNFLCTTHFVLKGEGPTRVQVSTFCLQYVSFVTKKFRRSLAKWQTTIQTLEGMSMSAKYQSAIWMDPCDNLLLGDGGYSFLLGSFTWQEI